MPNVVWLWDVTKLCLTAMLLQSNTVRGLCYDISLLTPNQGSKDMILFTTSLFLLYKISSETCCESVFLDVKCHKNPTKRCRNVLLIPSSLMCTFFMISPGNSHGKLWARLIHSCHFICLCLLNLFISQ